MKRFLFGLALVVSFNSVAASVKAEENDLSASARDQICSSEAYNLMTRAAHLGEQVFNQLDADAMNALRDSAVQLSEDAHRVTVQLAQIKSTGINVDEKCEFLANQAEKALNEDIFPALS